jgi:hypothetical protein
MKPFQPISNLLESEKVGWVGFRLFPSFHRLKIIASFFSIEFFLNGMANRSPAVPRIEVDTF